ncbi:alpha-E domain-containing protein [Flavimaricola marinus]|uniref:DUF403 domain-containing protein n=1 Tax=Flavimaricola marinus TaxID=1819565 RepID=A0A238LIC0_9RHOB|nr:alpha-E domain-containing protein [Flavimaricola marinus]SMY09145.1 hypothetical protein LOM8899_03307 [Flavimaricola marinus]
MLGKTAGGLYWMSRYLERSENTARMIEAGQRIALTRSSSDEEWISILQAAGTLAGYNAKYDTITGDTAIDWMLRDPANASSVMSVVEMARNNAKLVRTALTREVWEAINECWMVLKDCLARKVSERDLPQVLSKVRQRAAFVRGAMHGTMLRNDIYDFARIGTFIERADNTSRILDVKYYVLLPTALSVGSSIDNVQWESILSSVSAEGGYRLTYGQKVLPHQISQFLILDKRMPRSLSFCIHKIRDNLEYLTQDYGTRLPSADMADALCRSVSERSIHDIFEMGLHEFIAGFLLDLSALGQQTELDYRFNE